MKNILVTELINKKFEPFKINIQAFGLEYCRIYKPIKTRELLSVKLKKEKGATWLYWYWKPISNSINDFDCGYSGLLVKNKDDSESEFHKLNKIYFKLKN